MQQMITNSDNALTPNSTQSTIINASNSSQQQTTDGSEREKKRGLIIAELVETEKCLIADLFNLIQHFAQPTETASQIGEELAELKKSLRELTQFHQIFFTGLQNSLNGTDVDYISNCFLEYLPEMTRLYLPYCSFIHEDAVECLMEMKRTKTAQYSKLIEELKTNMSTRLELQDYLIKPIQSMTL